MTEFRVEWHQCPHVQHDRKVLFVEAETANDAKAIARDHIERRFGIEWFSIIQITNAVPVPAGKVKGYGT
jgi:hypothetical protein